MKGFKEFIESYASYADELANMSASNITLKDFFQEFGLNKVDTKKIEINKLLKLADTVIGAKTMLKLLPKTYQTNLMVFKNILEILAKPHHKEKWQNLLKTSTKSAKLTLANPMLALSAAYPFLSFLAPANQAIAMGFLKLLSSIYFYLNSPATQELLEKTDKEQVKKFWEKIKPLLLDLKDEPHIEQNPSNKA